MNITRLSNTRMREWGWRTNHMKHLRLILLPIAALLLTGAWQPVDSPRNVIVMVPDGTSDSLVTLARWYRNAPLAVDPLLRGRVRTYSANSLITDSAAAAAAMASGVKTHNNGINIGPREALYRESGAPEIPAGQPVASVLEAAKRTGRSVGIVSTSYITDATPAAFGGAHAMSRKSHAQIARQLVSQQPDVVLGGGFNMLQTIERGGARKDGLDLDLMWIANGGAVVTNRTQLAQHKSGRVWGGFSQYPMAAVMDRRDTAPGQPSLPEMTAHAIRLLSQNPKGFYLMIEGGHPDHGAHANDPAMAVTEFLEFDDAVAVALGFAKNNGRTLVLIATDHECGGLSIGNPRSGQRSTLESLVLPLKNMRASSFRMAEILGDDPSPEELVMNVRLWWRIPLSDDSAREILELASTSKYKLQSALNAVVSRDYLDIGWIYNDHTGGDVSFYAYGPDVPSGLIDNTDIARLSADAFRLKLDDVSSALFVDSRELFPDAQLQSDHLRLSDGSKIFFDDSVRIFPDNSRRPLGGLAVYIPETGICYLPREAAKKK